MSREHIATADLQFNYFKAVMFSYKHYITEGKSSLFKIKYIKGTLCNLAVKK